MKSDCVFGLSDDSVKYATLNLAIVGDDDLKEKYKEHVDSHNKKVVDSKYPDAGFDLFVPQDTEFGIVFERKMIDMKVKMEMYYNDNNQSIISSYYSYPRSSISKTPLMLANHVGIIDSGYRGNLMGAFRSLTQETYVVEKHSRLLQICHPSLCPIIVNLIDEDQLTVTSRGSGGFGSTGK
jgi:dUTP pyrophosphatase